MIIFCPTEGQGRYDLTYSTGGKDRNKKDVYEGDIVHHLQNEGNWQVVYNEKNCAFFLERWDKNRLRLTSACEPNIEVVGNIWENLELLKEGYGLQG